MANRKCKFNEVSLSCNSSTMLKLKDKRQSMKHQKVLFSVLWTIKRQKCKTLGMELEKKHQRVGHGYIVCQCTSNNSKSQFNKVKNKMPIS